MCLERFEYEESQQQSSKGKKATVVQEEDDIDWHDFELVATIEFEDDSAVPTKGAMSR